MKTVTAFLALSILSLGCQAEKKKNTPAAASTTAPSTLDGEKAEGQEDTLTPSDETETVITQEDIEGADTTVDLPAINPDSILTLKSDECYIFRSKIIANGRAEVKTIPFSIVDVRAEADGIKCPLKYSFEVPARMRIKIKPDASYKLNGQVTLQGSGAASFFLDFFPSVGQPFGMARGFSATSQINHSLSFPANHEGFRSTCGDEKSVFDFTVEMRAVLSTATASRFNQISLEETNLGFGYELEQCPAPL